MMILALLLADPAILSPQPWQVLQRTVGSSSAADTPAEPRGTGSAIIRLSGDDLLKPGMQAEIRLVPSIRGLARARLAASNQPSGDWTPLALKAVTPADSKLATATVILPAGGWYRLDVRLRATAGGAVSTATVEPIGVGEVFLIAGQSYATNTNDERLQVKDSQQRVSAYHWETGRWQLANDPQPAPDRSDGGSIWPPVGDRLAEFLEVPVGFVNVAVGGTSTRQWLPDGPLSERMHRVGQSVGAFRAVLWQQGESDVIEGTSAEDYVARLQAIRAAAVAAWKSEPLWLCAQSTHHPTVYNDPQGESRIRAAIVTVSELPGFGLGPDTDMLTGPNRGGPGSRRHFSPTGQQNAAKLWSDLLIARFFSSAKSTP
ncbi:MAG: sialate O-acetylesterase [Planctomycetaceae bacterium]